MRILFYAHSSTLYGANRSLIDLILGLKKRDPKMSLHLIIPSKDPISELLDKCNINYTVLPNFYWIYNDEVAKSYRHKGKLIYNIWLLKNKYQKQLQNIYYLKDHLKFVRKYKPNFIYVNSSLAPMGVMVANKLKISFVWHHRETINDKATGYYLEFNKKFNSFYRTAQIHIFSSIYLQNFYLENFGKVLSQVIYNGVYFKDQINDFNHIPNPKKLKFGMVGRINSQKNQVEIIDFFNSSKFKTLNIEYQLHIMGGGEDNYIKKIKESQISESIKFFGFLDKPYLFKEIDFLIINSVNEAFGRVVAEANFFGIPVIARRSGALPEIIDEEKNGFLYDNIEQFEELLIKLCNNYNLDDYRVISKSSRDYFTENFSLEDTTEQTFKLLNKHFQIKNLID